MAETKKEAQVELDENGYVIAKNLRGLSLEQTVESALSINK